MTITGSPRDTDFFQGLDLTFTCSIELHSAVNTPVLVQSRWQRNATELEYGSDNGITVTNTTIVTPPSNYQTTLRLNPTDVVDTETYDCTVTITSQNVAFITGTSVSTSRNVTEVSSKTSFNCIIKLDKLVCLADFPPQHVTISEEGISIAGYSSYTLLCTTTREHQLSSSSTISVQWLGSDGLEVSGRSFSIYHW